MTSKIPKELKLRRQWALSGEDKNPMSTDGIQTFDISIHNQKYLLSFEEAYYYANHFNLDYGYILYANDPYACIDLDVTDEESQIKKGQPIDPSKWTNQDDYDRYWNIIQLFKSYTEFSKSGKGLHIWVKGNIGEGRKRDGVELYSQERYIICTGKPILDNHIVDGQEILNNMKSQMAPIHERVSLQELPQLNTDDEIVDMAMKAENSAKFIALANGDWSGYPSQSEADLALMSMFTFYSKSNEQCKRLFRYSGLGQRAKATKDDRYLNLTLEIIRSREAKQEHANATNMILAMEEVARLQKVNKESNFLHTNFNVNNEEFKPSPSVTFAETFNPVPVEEIGIAWPPGFIGQIAYYIYNSSPRPVKEVAIVSALGLMAGICGKAWNITQSGLNMYIILIARSGIGKEALHSGISSLISAVTQQYPSAINFVNFTDFASGPALKKATANNSCFVNVAGEFGKKLQRLAKDDGRDVAMHSLRTAMTDLYQKSGQHTIVGGLTYSSKDENIASTNGVAFSVIGETTPGTFYDSLNYSMMSDGFLSRFNIVEFNGLRPPLNPNRIRKPDVAITDNLADLCQQAEHLNMLGETISVQRSEEVARIIADFESECDNNINSSEDECWRQMWNRAALKVLKLAALLSVGDNHLNPIIQVYHINWALNMVRKDIEIFQTKIQSGDIGISDNTRETKLISIMTDYLTTNIKLESGEVKMKESGVITRKHLQHKITGNSSFEKHPMGTAKALDITIRALLDNGHIVEIADSLRLYEFNGKCYRIVDLTKTIFS